MIAAADVADDIIHSIAWGIASKNLAKRLIKLHKHSHGKRWISAFFKGNKRSPYWAYAPF